ncbi:GYF domain-containing protein [Xanthomonas sp. NCPPB 2654]|uniref:GYF domain-containing protein n=1 Tax=unclassified Xanthomonas TaxID=2643310 RepID=UPI0021DF46F5|nr:MULTISPECIES: GYF domain-containing protein [unclassified Xanthomonas]MDL5367906.1 GYF domain-containing protein [Xanthomonas sp. NCPPB 2654]UYC22969.1 GYF domain-containing protein [Xanthomonas sp. CFBP 8443]
MSAWYYADAARHRHGPLSTAELRERVRDGLLERTTLVWREGMPEWQPLQALAAELGLPAVATPPPLPPPPPVATATAVAAPRAGLSGCGIGAIVAIVLGLVLVAVLGILAAIAMPAYRDYTLRAHARTAIDGLDLLKGEVVAFAAQQGRCPVNGDPGFDAAQDYASEFVKQVRIGRFDNGHCGLEATLHAPGKDKLDGKALWLDYDAQAAAWNCSSELDDRYLPAHCRGG